MSYFSNIEDRSLEGPGCGSQCNCGPCKSGVSGLGDAAASGFGLAATVTNPPSVLRTCPTKGIPPMDTVHPFTSNKVFGQCVKRGVFKESDPAGVISRAVARAVKMLDHTIGELVNARTAICSGAEPLLSEITLDWLRNRLGVCIGDVRVWTAGPFENRSVAEVIRRLMRVRNLIGSNLLRYVCAGPLCESDWWAYVFALDDKGECLPGTPSMLVRLCKNFWVPAKDPITSKPTDAAVHAEFQAQTIIHEVSHLTHCNKIERGSTIAVPECLAQFVAATNGSPLDPLFGRSCATTTRCAGTGSAAPPAVAGLGAAGSDSKRIVKTVFHPEKAMRLKDQPAMRRLVVRR